MERKKIVIIGAGLAGLSSAALLSRDGFDVTVLDKLPEPGGVAGRYEEAGFLFDTGPSWYLMNGVYDRFFGFFGRKPSDYYELVRLDPSYRIFFEDGTRGVITRDPAANERFFDSLQEGGGRQLRKFLANSELKYRISVDKFLYREYRSFLPFLNPLLLAEGFRLNIFAKLDRFVSSYFTDVRARQVLEFNTVFLGSSPFQTPALYSLMAHADITEGVSFPRNGIYDLVSALFTLCKEQGVSFRLSTPVTRIDVRGGRAVGVDTPGGSVAADCVVAATDYHHAETALLDPAHRNYSERYWKTRVMAPATFLILLGVNRPVPALSHHNFYFATDWKRHFDSIFSDPAWPDNPSYYVGVPSRTSSTLAPAGGETLFVLVPVAPGLADTPDTRKSFSDRIIGHLAGLVGQPDLAERVVVKKVIAHEHFQNTMNYYKGASLGLSHTLFQTALFRPSHGSRKVRNLYYTGHYTQPGIGMPMAIIGSELLAARIGKEARLPRNLLG